MNKNVKSVWYQKPLKVTNKKLFCNQMQVCFDIGKKSINHGNKFVYFHSTVRNILWYVKNMFWIFFLYAEKQKHSKIVDDLNLLLVYQLNYSINLDKYVYIFIKLTKYYVFSIFNDLRILNSTIYNKTAYACIKLVFSKIL